MVILTLTPAGKSASDKFCASIQSSFELLPEDGLLRSRLLDLEIGGPIHHHDLISLSQSLLKYARGADENLETKLWRLDTLLKGAKVYQPPPLAKSEPTSEYKALMKKLREEDERRQYDRMLNPLSQQGPSGLKLPNAIHSFDPAISIGQTNPADEIDDVTLADVNRQMVLIINVLVSIIACSVAIWIGARRWEVHHRLALSLLGSATVAIAEVAIYLGYIKRIKDAKLKEVKKPETKEIVDTWVLDGRTKGDELNTIRFRKGKHR